MRTFDMQFVEDLFEMAEGYVLDFSNRSISSFFAEEINVGINYDVSGISGALIRSACAAS